MGFLLLTLSVHIYLKCGSYLSDDVIKLKQWAHLPACEFSQDSEENWPTGRRCETACCSPAQLLSQASQSFLHSVPASGSWEAGGEERTIGLAAPNRIKLSTWALQSVCTSVTLRCFLPGFAFCFLLIALALKTRAKPLEILTGINWIPFYGNIKSVLRQTHGPDHEMPCPCLITVRMLLPLWLSSLTHVYSSPWF